MRSKLATYALAGAVGLTGIAGAALVAPAASYAASGDSSTLERRVSSIKQALQGLVDGGTISQSQADKVASTLAEARPDRFGGRGRAAPRLHLAAAAEALGITREELHDAAEAGKSLADLAEENDVSNEDLVDALVAAVKEHLDEAVGNGRLTQAEAGERLEQAESRITDRLDDPIRQRAHHRGKPAEAPAGIPGEEPATLERNDA